MQHPRPQRVAADGGRGGIGVSTHLMNATWGSQNTRRRKAGDIGVSTHLMNATWGGVAGGGLKIHVLGDQLGDRETPALI